VFSPPAGGGGYLGLLVTGGVKAIFGLKVVIWDSFWVRNFLVEFFGYQDFDRPFLGLKNSVPTCTSCRVAILHQRIA